MKSTFLNQIFTDIPITVIGLLLFFMAFMGLLGWVFLRKGAKEKYKEISKLPLREEDGHYGR